MLAARRNFSRLDGAPGWVGRTIVVGELLGWRPMAWKVGAEETRFLEPDAAIPGREQLMPVGPTHAVDSETGEVACGFRSEALNVFDLDWVSADLVERCPDCVQAVAEV